MKKSTKVEKIKLDDFEEIYSLWKDSNITVSPIRQEKYEFEMMVRMNPSTSLCIRKNGKIIGAGIGAYNGKCAWIYHLAISPAFQKKGFGSLLLGSIEKALAKLEITKIELEVYSSKSYNVGFYQKHGFNVKDQSIHLEKNLIIYN